MVKLTVQRSTRRTNRHYLEDLGQGIQLDMVLIEGGTFQMGSPETEEDRSPTESPQHFVTVPTFFMGRYPVTQKQWRFVAQKIDPVDIDLRGHSSKFPGNKHPVEIVRWQEAVEFCDRQSANASMG